MTDERIKRTKDKLRVYGNYTRQIQQLERRLQEINDATPTGQSRLPKSAGSTVWIPSTLRCSV